MQAIIFLNGKIPKFELVNKFIRKKTFIIAADAGANYLKRTNIIPDIIIGDLDSIDKDLLSYFKNKKVKIKKIKDQETTDFEKSLKYCSENNLLNINVFGATGFRPDHALNNFSVLKRYYKNLSIKFITEVFEIFFIKKKINFKYKSNEIISLLAMPLATGIVTSGLEYKLDNEDLEFGKREGTLNKSVSENIFISFVKGDLLLFKKHFIN